MPAKKNDQSWHGLTEGPKTIRIEMMVPEEMYTAIRARARRIAGPGDGAKHIAEATRQYVAEGILADSDRETYIRSEDKEEAARLSAKTIQKTRDKWAAQKEARARRG